ncbi:MAG: flagellar hook-length control protein FliK [Methylophilus sp.]|uniref:flagellar hook-length control protein FliK n=1 Tax=Methylophilus sp. TaxID=29541 RepID=UPI002B6A4664|nr:flagellar hook-length control protein FliK [Methylophilus sp.]HSH87819.1 flagellar hook-length control protein FliK [Methylophilus sp.]
MRAVSSIMPVEGAQSEAPLWSRLRPGMQFTGLILQKESSAGNGSELANFKVQIQLPNQQPAVVQMQLPSHLAQQQALQMQYLGLPQGQAQSGKEASAAHPMVRWGVQAQAKSGEASTTGLATAGLLADTAQSEGAGDLPHLLGSMAGQTASQVDLSNPAQQLQRWLSSPMFQHQAAALQAQTIVSHSPQKPQVLAQDLKHALDSSGLFYESHLKDAALGSRPWHQLLQEPQNKPNFLPPEMVAQQLQVLEQQRLSWHGEVWPGQTMQWEITERESSAHSSEDPSLNAIQSNLKLTLPRLGEVSVRITMVNGRFAIRVQPQQTSVLATMQSTRSELATNLQSAGLTLESLQIASEAHEAASQSYAAG